MNNQETLDDDAIIATTLLAGSGLRRLNGEKAEAQRLKKRRRDGKIYAIVPRLSTDKVSPCAYRYQYRYRTSTSL